MTDFVSLMPKVATELLGKPNVGLSSATELRYGTNGSLAIDLEHGRWFDHEQQEGGGVLDLIARETGCNSNGGAHDWLRDNGFVSRDSGTRPRMVATYDYVDEDGVLLLQVVRFAAPKTFKQRKPDGASGWEWRVRGVRQVPYRLPALVEAIALGRTVFIVEGEKDADALAELGVAATCNAGGAGKWRPELADHFAGAEVVILPDNDETGRDHAIQVAKALSGIAAKVKILDLPGLPPKGDVSDWLAAGGTVETLHTLAEAAPSFGEPAASRSAAGDDGITEDWPQPLGADAYHGIAGELVRAIEPNTEADAAAILLQFLVAFGNIAGRRAYLRIEGDRHPAQLWAVLVGRTSKGRKGTSWGRVRQVLEAIDPQWANDKIIPGGLATGEGIVYAVRDPVTKIEDDGSETVTDPGVEDKRLLVLESEFASPLRHMERGGNILSSTLRPLWDSGSAGQIVKHSPTRTIGAMVSVVGHITDDELRRYLTRTELANGLANRFLFAMVRRTKRLPFGGADFDPEPFVDRLKEAKARAWADQRIGWTDDGATLWEAVYGDLSEGRPGLVGAVTSRAETQVLRLALTYALLDGEPNIGAGHIKAALAVWRYCDQSARIIFGTLTGNPVADEILRLLRATPEGMTRTDISNALGRHQSSAAISQALRELQTEGLAWPEARATTGRPEERWRVRE